MRRIALLLALLALAGCLEPGPGTPTTSPPPTAPTSPTPRGEALETRTLDKGSFSPIGEDAREILRNETAWSALWARHRADESPPAVDFAREMVVAVVVHGPTGCGAMHLGDVTHEPTGPTVTTTIVLEVAPREVQCLVAFEDVYHFVAVPRRVGDARWIETQEPAPREPTPTAPTEEPTGEYAFRTLEQGTASGIEERRREVIADIDAWRAFWIEHSAPFDPAPPMPEVDWELERVFVATAGTRSNICWAIAVDKITVEETNVVAQVTTTKPAPDRVCGMAVSHPFHYVTYPITDKPLITVEAEG